MGWFDYYFNHVFYTGWRTIGSAFKIWRDLMTDNFADYALLQTDDPFEECRGWFWVTLGEDDVYPKEFLEYLQDLCDRIDRGEEELIPLDMDQMNRIMELIEDVEIAE
jgi:hypothetical protein